MLAFLKIPKVQLASTLLLIALTAILHKPLFSHFFIFLLALGFSILFDLLFLTLRKVKLFMPYAAIVSGLIIGLLTGPETLWYQIAVTAALAMAVKNFLRISGRHVFNPAGTGLFLAGMFFHSTVSWWGVSFQQVAGNLQNVLFFAILLSPLLVSSFRMRRYNSVLWFFIIYTALVILVRHDFTFDTLRMTIFDPTVIFFAIVMLPEPMTSPVNLKRQIAYGAFVACGALILSLSAFGQFLSTAGFFPDPLIAALLLGNLLFFRFR